MSEGVLVLDIVQEKSKLESVLVEIRVAASAGKNLQESP